MLQRLKILLLPLLAVSCTHHFGDVVDNTPVGNFDVLWKTIDTKYCFVEDKHVDWDEVYDRYLPAVKALKATDEIALFDTLSSMLDLLEDGHVNLYSGFDVFSSSKWYEGYPNDYNWGLIQSNYLRDYRSVGGMYYNTIFENVGYIYYGSFSNNFSSANLAYIFSSFKNCKGLILDVRHNGGGSMENAYRLASAFFKEDKVVGYWQHKSGAGHNDFSPLKEMVVEADAMKCKWLRPVVVLCDRHTYSAANFFVNAMRYAPKAIIMGGTSGGGGGMPLSYELPNGWMVRFSSIRMLDSAYVSIEPGIEPDIKLTNSSTEMDEVIMAAVRYIYFY
ncbi:MAG: S41 family peptidase [Bacteroidales bacterium]|nr:S41 family peptidase [Candidatus Colicola coprequi]